MNISLHTLDIVVPFVCVCVCAHVQYFVCQNVTVTNYINHTDRFMWILFKLLRVSYDSCYHSIFCNFQLKITSYDKYSGLNLIFQTLIVTLMCNICFVFYYLNLASKQYIKAITIYTTVNPSDQWLC